MKLGILAIRRKTRSKGEIGGKVISSKLVKASESPPPPPVLSQQVQFLYEDSFREERLNSSEKKEGASFQSERLDSLAVKFGQHTCVKNESRYRDGLHGVDGGGEEGRKEEGRAEPTENPTEITVGG